MPFKRPIDSVVSPKVATAAKRLPGIAFVAWLAALCTSHPLAAAPAGPPSATGPEAAIVRVNRETGGHCTGFAIDARTVATAAHCLWLERPRNWIQPASLHVLTGYDRGAFRQHLRVKAYFVSADYAPAGRPGAVGQGGDWALLELTTPFEGPALPLAQEPPAPGAVLSLAGYSGKRGHRLTRLAVCRVAERSRTQFLHDCPAWHGQSGAPLFAVEDGRRVAFGLHAASGGAKGLAVAAPAIRREAARRPY